MSNIAVAAGKCKGRRELLVFDINEMRPAPGGPLIRVSRDY